MIKPSIIHSPTSVNVTSSMASHDHHSDYFRIPDHFRPNSTFENHSSLCRRIDEVRTLFTLASLSSLKVLLFRTNNAKQKKSKKRGEFF